MADLPIHRPQGPSSVPESAPNAPKAKKPHTEGTPAFHALLADLQVQAQELRDTSAGVDDPTRLAGAVDRARESLEDALSLGDQLLEAYRESVHQDEDPRAAERPPGPPSDP
jgi:hypothetical protein